MHPVFEVKEGTSLIVSRKHEKINLTRPIRLPEQILIVSLSHAVKIVGF